MVSAVNTGVPSAGGRVNSPGYEQQGDFTYFGPTSSSVLSHLITVHEVPLLLLAFNLVGSDTVQVLIATQTSAGITSSPLVLNTRAVVLSAQSNALLLDLPGVYRLQISEGSLGAATVVGQETNFSYASYGLAAYANPPGSGGGTCVFTMPHSDESGDFSVATTLHGYSVQDPDFGPAIVATLPTVSTATGQIYVVQQGVDPSSGGHAGLDVGSASTINEGGSPVHLDCGMVAALYATDSDWNLVNYAQISTDAGNLLEWVPGVPSGGGGLFVPAFGAGTSGLATLVAGEVVVSTAIVTANSLIFLTEQTLGTVSAGQGLWIKSRVPGTSFTIGSAGGTDTSTVAWLIVEP